ncbi:hypothetical protein [Curtobacterium luteum]|uniref:hypothetical protein n=1 Tax=Curtobacterium luteum TaxID=33881 RepID=UPI00187C80AA|nr:hypothetical protein [Curtobacterium luteum]
MTSTDGRPDHLVPLDAVPVGQHVIVPDEERPVAAVLRDGEFVRWLTWPDAPLPERAVDGAESWPTPDGLWIVYRSEGIEETTRTAVHLDPERVGAAVDLGDRRVVGVDATGLWLADPRDASAWMGQVGIEDGDDDEGGEDEDEDELDGLASDDLPWAEAGPFWPDPTTWVEPTDEDDEDAWQPEDDDADRNDDADPDPDDDIDPDDDTDPDGDTDPDADGEHVVATAYQWSIGFADDADAFDAPELSEPGPPSPTPPTELQCIAPDGTRTTVQVDHLVEGASVDGDSMTVRFHRTGPDLVPGRFGGHDVVYRPRAVVVDVSGGFPRSIDTESLDSVPVEDDEGYDADAADAERERVSGELGARRSPFVDRLDLDGVDGTRWRLRELDTAAREHATTELAEEFTHLADPAVGWSRGVDGPRRIRSDYRDLRVEVEGEWPGTEVEVSFEHAAVPFLRLRRRYRVFDDTGRPVDHGYVTVHLEEDIATGHIPPRSAAVDGVLDI